MNSVAVYRIEERYRDQVEPPVRFASDLPAISRGTALVLFAELLADDAASHQEYVPGGPLQLVLTQRYPWVRQLHPDNAPQRGYSAAPARALPQRKVCARCGYPPRLAGVLVIAAASCEGVRWLCANSDGCAGRRRLAEAGAR